MYTYIIARTIKICNIDRYGPIVDPMFITYARDTHKYP